MRCTDKTVSFFHLSFLPKELLGVQLSLRSHHSTTAGSSAAVGKLDASYRPSSCGCLGQIFKIIRIFSNFFSSLNNRYMTTLGGSHRPRRPQSSAIARSFLFFFVLKRAEPKKKERRQRKTTLSSFLTPQSWKVSGKVFAQPRCRLRTGRRSGLRYYKGRRRGQETAASENV